MQMIISITFISFCLILLCFSVSWVCTKRMRSESVSGPEVLVTVSALIQERVFRQRELCAADPVATARDPGSDTAWRTALSPFVQRPLSLSLTSKGVSDG